jgi:pyruvate formate lyase activating enzyme
LNIKGFVDVSFVDWDKKICSVIFVPGCNFRCPFCHNVNLVLHHDTIESISFPDIEDQLKRQKSWIDGVCITGGEPTLQKSLLDLCQKIKNIDLLVKLDTNGTNPPLLKDLIDRKIVDYIAMDIKSPLTVEKYSKAIGVNAEIWLSKVKQSIQLLMDSDIDYEFRTTIVPVIHDLDDITQICYSIKNCKKFVLQKFDVTIGKSTINPSFSSVIFSDQEMKKFLLKAQEIIPDVKSRGINN